MRLTFTVHGRSCDLALHPVSSSTARKIREKGSAVYSDKPLDWWRKGKTATWGMKVDEDSAIQVLCDEHPVAFDPSAVTATPLKLRRRMYLDSKARYLCVLGFDNEVCKFTWIWDDVKAFEPEKFDFLVHKWDRIMDIADYNILDEIRYDGRFADRNDWCEPQGFTLVEPRIIDLDEVRKEWANKAWDEHEEAPALSFGGSAVLQGA